MRSMTLSDGRRLATNDHDGGVFAYRSDGSKTQWAGTSQTPTFRSAQHFWRWLKRHYGEETFPKGVRMVSNTFER